VVHDNAHVQSQSDEFFQGMTICIFYNFEHELRELETKKEWVFNIKRYQMSKLED
jgi:hypothetical protein